jgi:membrane-associated protease RseP (regulator of RpoE activity)
MQSIQTPTLESQVDPLEQDAKALQSKLAGLFQVSRVNLSPTRMAISFDGEILNDPEASFEEIQRRFKPLGYTPMLRSEKGEDVVVALEGIIDRQKTGKPWINIALFVATIFTTLAAGAAMAGDDLLGAVLSGSLEEIVQAVLAGAPFTIALLGILGVHELGHYFAAKIHGVQATLPYFIPLPVIGFGTLGAFINIKTPMKNRKVLFDIGMSGPIAGLIVAVPLMLIGLYLSSENYVPAGYFGPGWTLEQLGSSAIVNALLDVVVRVPPGRTLLIHPIFFAAWLGFFLTGINLLPVGQLDGGHAAYALLGRRAYYVAIITFFLLILAGALLSINWFIWAFFILIGGLRHPPPMNDITDPGPARKLIGILAIILFLLIVTPIPFR